MEEGSFMPQMCRYPGHEHTWIKAKNNETFSLYFSSEKGLVSYGTQVCPLFRKSSYSTKFWNSITFSDPGVLLQYVSKKSKHCCVILLKSICILCLI